MGLDLGWNADIVQNHRSEDIRVRRQRLEPRTRGLRVSCPVRFNDATSCDFMDAPAKIHDSQPDSGAAWYRLLLG